MEHSEPCGCRWHDRHGLSFDYILASRGFFNDSHICEAHRQALEAILGPDGYATAKLRTEQIMADGAVRMADRWQFFVNTPLNQWQT